MVRQLDASSYDWVLRGSSPGEWLIAEQKPTSFLGKEDIPDEWRLALWKIVTGTNPPAPPLKPMSGKVWLQGNKAKGIEAGFDRFPQQDNESIRAWSRRLSAEAGKEAVTLTPRGIEARIHERRRTAK